MRGQFRYKLPRCRPGRRNRAATRGSRAVHARVVPHACDIRSNDPRGDIWGRSLNTDMDVHVRVLPEVERA